MYRPPPEPVACPNDEWADRYARWYEDERGPEYRVTFTDKEAAKRLLDRHKLEVAAHMDAENLHSAEDLIRMPVCRWLGLIVQYDTDEPEG